jgi:hypothetical protein
VHAGAKAEARGCASSCARQARPRGTAPRTLNLTGRPERVPMKARITLVPTGVPVSLACSLAIISGRVLKVRSRTSCRCLTCRKAVSYLEMVPATAPRASKHERDFTMLQQRIIPSEYMAACCILLAELLGPAHALSERF